MNIERLWRSVKYECIYINAFTDGKILREGVKRYFDWYNQERSHQALDEQTPYEVYLGLPCRKRGCGGRAQHASGCRK